MSELIQENKQEIQESSTAITGMLPHIEEDVTKWPIHKFSEERENVLDELVKMSVEDVRKILNNPEKLNEELAKTMYREQIRLKTDPWKVDDVKGELKFWKKVRKTLVKTSVQQANEEKLETEEQILETVIRRYAEEIAGSFNPNTYKWASRILPMGFNFLLNSFSTKKFWSTKYQITDRVKITGQLEKIRSLAQQGTLVLVPTHFSNLDSIIIGWGLHSIGLPAFIYGAGWNLFNSRVLGYFMGGLGAYRVDRRKKNLPYLITLKNYAKIALEHGTHSLFFPGGTRSRSGQIENRLKLGLLGSVIRAQRTNFLEAKQAGKDLLKADKIFIVPLVLNYHFTLEASSLIEGHLKRSGKDKYYIDKDVFPSRRKVTRFLWKFLATTKSEIILSFGEPMDIFGHGLGEQGESLDQYGRPIDTSAYFTTGGKFNDDTQRDHEYTRMLGERILEQYYRYNTVLSSHLVAFVAFEMLKRKHRRLDLYALLRLPQEDCRILRNTFAEVMLKIRQKLKEMEEAGKVQLASHMYGDVQRLINHGILNLGAYHAKDPLKRTKDDEHVYSEDMNLLYYYHNRLMGYGLEDMIG